MKKFNLLKKALFLFLPAVLSCAVLMAQNTSKMNMQVSTAAKQIAEKELKAKCEVNGIAYSKNAASQFTKPKPACKNCKTAGIICDTTFSFAPALAIPDNIATGATNSQTVAGAPGTTLGADVNLTQICFAIRHTWVGDLTVILTAPNGTQVTLMSRPGVPTTTVGCSGDSVNACVILGVGNEMEGVCGAPPALAIAGSFNAADGTDLNAINVAGGSPNGSWSLFVRDSAGLDTGTLDNWSLTFSSGPNASWNATPAVLCATSGTIDLAALVTGDPGGTWSGTGVTGSTFDPTGLSGAITVTYTVITTCTTSVSHDFTVVASTAACSFSAAVNNTDATFTNATTGADSYSWDFGDGSAPDITENPSHTYATNGTFTVILSATNVCGTVTCSQDVTIAGCPDLITDGGFEIGLSTPWDTASVNFGTPLCDVPTCGLGTGTGPHNGSAFWVWFGGVSVPEEGHVSQSVTIPTGTAATLYFYLEQIVCDGPTDFVEVLIDGTNVFTSDGSSTLCGQLGYTLETVNLTAYADGLPHTLEFHSQTFAVNGGGSNFFIDDVSLLACPTGINEQTIAESINVQPNPASTDLLISLKGIKADNVTIGIYDMLGQPVYSTVVNKNGFDFNQSIDVSKWSKGTYALRIQTSTKSITRKISVMRAGK